MKRIYRLAPIIVCVIVLVGCDQSSLESLNVESMQESEGVGNYGQLNGEVAKEKSEKRIYVKSDDLVELAAIDVKVLQAHETNIVSDGFSPSIAKEGAKFIVVDIAVKNTTNKTFMYDEDEDELVDDKDRSYKPVGSFQYIENNIDLRDLSPDVTEEGSIVFEVPLDSNNHHLKFCKGGSSECFYIPISPLKES